jgi:TonB family protein
METHAVYLLKSAAWLAGFAIVYFLFLRNERFFFLKRYFLIAGIIISFIFPLITFHYQVEVPVPAISNSDLVQSSNASGAGIQKVMPVQRFDYRLILLFMYLAGVIFLLFRNILHIRSLYRVISNSEIVNLDEAKLIRAPGFTSSFSFFNYVFINPSVNETEAGEIMNHELVHVRQKHWFDLVLVELLRIVQWANPFAWIYTAFIKLNHEYLADEIALRRTSNPAIYRAALVNQLFSSPVISFSNSFNYSLNKKRFDMMKKIITSPWRKLKILLILPVFAILFYAFATTEYHYSDPASENIMTISEAPSIMAKTVKGIVLNEDNKPMFGVNVIVSGTITGAFTDQTGHFMIGNVPEGSSLVFTSIGYKTKTLNPDFSEEMTVSMTKETGLTPPDLKLVPPPIYPQGQTPPPAPLIIIDGVVNENGLKNINPNQISTISVLKNKSATAVFGEKGENGVIIVTLKKAVSLNSTASQTVQKEVKGTVVRPDGKPLEGACIMSTGTSGNAAIAFADAEGKFTIKVTPEASLLITGKAYKGKVLKPPFVSDLKVTLEIDPDYVEVVQVEAKPAGQRDQRIEVRRPQPLVVVDGVFVEKQYNEVKKELGYDFGIMKMIQAKDAVEKYGDKGKNGVIEITTRKKAFEMGLKPPFPRLKSDDYPTFQGNLRGYFDDWLISQLKYPADAATKGIHGRVRVSFIVELDGSVSNIKITGTPDPVLAAAVTKIIEGSPKWDPPKNNMVDEGYRDDVTIKFDLPDNVSIYTEPFVVVEQMPMYPGGDGELLKFIAENTHYPDSAKARGIQGRVIIRFIVNTEGRVEEPSVLKGVDPLLDSEAIRVVSSLPAFKPGYQGGKPVNVWYMVPITFTLK